MNQHIINAIATYICIEASTKDVFTGEVDLLHISGLYGATQDEINASYPRAREILRDFLEYNRYFQAKAVNC